MTTPLGLIGIGLLGTALAERLLASGFSVLGFDIDAARCEALGSLGGRAASDALEVIRTCDRVVLSLPTSDHVDAVLFQASDALRAGQTIVDTTTGDPETVAAIGARLEAVNIDYLDATISGSSEQVRRGDAIVMAGGAAKAFEECRDIFGAIARAAFHVGECGAGATTKLATNLVLGLNRAALAEGLSFARRMGLDLELTLTVLREGAAYSRVMDTKGGKMVAGDFATQARLSQHLKDVRLILAEARRHGALTPLTEVHRSLLEAAEASGYGDADNSAVIRAYEP